jgi:hypothetical protein
MRSGDALPMQYREPVSTGSVDLKSEHHYGFTSNHWTFLNLPLSRCCAED